VSQRWPAHGRHAQPSRAILHRRGKNNGVPLEQIAAAAELTVEQVQRVFRDIDQKRKTTQYLHLGPALVEDVAEIGV
jgi:hypothetical protein